MLIPTFTEEFKADLVAKAEKNLFLFAKGCCRFKDYTTDFHYELCENLDGRGTWGPDWRRGLVSMFRGSLKTTTLVAYFCREGIYKKNWAGRYIGSSYENAQINFLFKIHQLWRDSEQASFLQWLYEERLPAGFEGWTDKWATFVRDDPNAPPTISIKGITSDQEGWHGPFVAIDDPEGAEAERSIAHQVDARRMVSNAVPLLINQKTDKILVICTPHGPDPLAHRLLHQNLDPEVNLKDERVEWDNKKRVWKVHWKPIVAETGEPAWPERFGKDEIRLLEATTDPDTWAKQYLLRRSSLKGNWFSAARLRQGFCAWKVPGRIVEYPAMSYDAKLYRETGELNIKIERRTAHVTELRTFIHFDPVHKETPTSYGKKTSRQSKAAIVAVGVTPDFHVIVLETWAGLADLAGQLRECYRMHIKYAAAKFTIDPIGAQSWISDVLLMQEKANPIYEKLTGSMVYAEGRPIPRLSSIMEEDKRSPRISKEASIQERLEPWVSFLALHFFEDQHEIVNQMLGFPDDAEYIDLVDALAQGPPVWSPPLSNEVAKKYRDEQDVLRKIAHEFTGYSSPFRRKPAKETRPRRLTPQ